MKAYSRLTVVETLVVIIFLGIVGTIAFDRYWSLQMVHRDQDRKVAINTMYYNLEEVVKPLLKGYPRVLSANQLTAMDRALLKDPDGFMIGQADSDYHYQPTGCNGGDTCEGFVLRADLERENDFVKTSPRS